MTRLTHFAAIAAALALAACDSKPDTTAPRPLDPMAENMAAPATPVELPPAITSSKAYRCKDNSVVYIDRFQGDAQAAIKTDAKATPVFVRGEPGGELTGDGGYALSSEGETMMVTLPGKAKQACKA